MEQPDSEAENIPSVQLSASEPVADWGIIATVGAVSGGIAKIRLNIFSKIVFGIVFAALLLVALVVLVAGLSSFANNLLGLIGFIVILVLALLFGASFLLAVNRVAELGDAAGKKLKLGLVAKQSGKASFSMLVFLPFYALSNLPTYAFAPYIIVDTLQGPFSALSESRKLSKLNNNRNKTLKVDIASSIIPLGSLGQQAGEIAVAGLYLAAKETSIVQTVRST